MTVVMNRPLRPTFDKIKAREKMDAAGKSYADLGRALGMGRQTVGHWFRDRGEPSVKQMKAMGDELGCHWLELVNEETMVIYRADERRRIARTRALTPQQLAKLDAFLEVEVPEVPDIEE